MKDPLVRRTVLWYDEEDEGLVARILKLQEEWLPRDMPLNMGVPRHHMAKGKQLRRRSHLALKKMVLSACGQCKKMIKPHTVCKYCGYYKGREVVNVLAKKMKRAEKKKHQTK